MNIHVKDIIFSLIYLGFLILVAIKSSYLGHIDGFWIFMIIITLIGIYSSFSLLFEKPPKK